MRTAARTECVSEQRIERPASAAAICARSLAALAPVQSALGPLQAQQPAQTCIAECAAGSTHIARCVQSAGGCPPGAHQSAMDAKSV